ncbi:hypothetical protein VE04_05922 [Pseudogymnoascus sp. 24MN13]|nr:hypothetical protein VE04_05922 [Pseudogymnoascus sp. 24MN13]
MAASTASVPDRGIQLMVLMWVMTILASITVVMRFIFRAQKSIIGYDDLFMFISMICFFGWTISLTLLCLKGGERHMADVGALGPDIVAQVQLLNWTSQVFGIIGIGAGKVSVSALILTIIRDTQRAWQKIYLWTFCIVLVLCVSVSCSILTFAQCRPAAALWDSRVEGTCIKPTVMASFGIFTGAYNTFVDASLSLIPATIFWTLQMGFQEKMTLTIVFALNILTSICSGIKTSYLSELGNRTDFTWATYDIFAWVTAEFFLVIVCGSTPTLRPLISLLRRQLGYTSKDSRNSYLRHTGDSGVPSKDAFQLDGFRRNVASETTVSKANRTENYDRSKNWEDMSLAEDIRVERTYRVQINNNDSQQELNVT